jgi:hypothetical protein
MNIPRQKYSIAILTCWYGSYPWYFPYFVHSCSHNPSIDFYIITDNEQPILNRPANVKIIYKTLCEIKETATDKLGFTVDIKYPYKLCDFKPTYGYLFPEIIDGYDFWGHADIDVVYGNIRGFITDEILCTYDIISSRHDYVTGSFCLFRNDERINSFFKESRDYQKVLSRPENFCFDECSFLWEDLKRGASIFDFPNHTESMTYLVKKAQAEGRIKAYFDFIIVEGIPGNIQCNEGKVFYKNYYEVLYYHLVMFKNEAKRPVILNPVPDSFYFTPRKIIPGIKATGMTHNIE